MYSVESSLIIKLIITLIFAVGSFIIIDANTWLWVIVVGIASTVINHFLSIKVVLPELGSFAAAISSGLLAPLTAYAVNLIAPGFTTSAVSLAIFAITVGSSEYIFQEYMDNFENIQS